MDNSCVLHRRARSGTLNGPGSLERQFGDLFDAASAARGAHGGRERRWEFAFVPGRCRYLLGDVLVEPKSAPDEAPRRAPSPGTRAMHASWVVALGMNVRLHRQLSEAERMRATAAVVMNVLNTVRALGHRPAWAAGAGDCDRAVLSALGFRGPVRLAGIVFTEFPAHARIAGATPVRHRNVAV